MGSNNSRSARAAVPVGKTRNTQSERCDKCGSRVGDLNRLENRSTLLTEGPLFDGHTSLEQQNHIGQILFGVQAQLLDIRTRLERCFSALGGSQDDEYQRALNAFKAFRANHPKLVDGLDVMFRDERIPTSILWPVEMQINKTLSVLCLNPRREEKETIIVALEDLNKVMLKFITKMVEWQLHEGTPC